MNPQIYFDITVNADAQKELTIPIMERCFNILHRVFRASPNRYVIALPYARIGKRRFPGTVIRIFAENRNDLDELVNNIRDHPIIRDYVNFGYPRSIPDNFGGPWREYRRYRITNRKSRLEKCREYRLKNASNFPYFKTVSKTNGNLFGIYITVLEKNCGGDCQPDSYGLSVADRSFALPVI